MFSLERKWNVLHALLWIVIRIYYIRERSRERFYGEITHEGWDVSKQRFSQMFHTINFAFHFSQFRIYLKTSLKVMSATFIKFYTSLATSVTTSSPLQHRHLLFVYIFRQDLQVYHTLRDCVRLLLPLLLPWEYHWDTILLYPSPFRSSPPDVFLGKVCREPFLRTTAASVI